MKKKQPKRSPPHTLPTRADPHPDDVDPQSEAETSDQADDAVAGLPAVSRVANARQIPHFISDIKSAEQQVGEHILTALQDPGTVAVLTAVMVGPDNVQRIVSAALDPELLQQVQQLMQVAQTQREEEEPCVGFHCLLKHKDPTP